MLSFAVLSWIGQGLGHGTMPSTSSVLSSLVQEKELQEDSVHAYQKRAGRTNAATGDASTTESSEEQWAQDGAAEEVADQEDAQMQEMIGGDDSSASFRTKLIGESKADSHTKSYPTSIVEKVSSSVSKHKRSVTDAAVSCDYDCYAEKYPDLKKVWCGNTAALANHWRDHGSKKENRQCPNSCTKTPCAGAEPTPTPPPTPPPPTPPPTPSDAQKTMANAEAATKLRARMGSYTRDEASKEIELVNGYEPDHIKLVNKIDGTNKFVTQEHQNSLNIFANMKPVVDSLKQSHEKTNTDTGRGRVLLTGDQARLEAIRKAYQQQSTIAATKFNTGYKNMASDEKKKETDLSKFLNSEMRREAQDGFELASDAAKDARDGEAALIKQALKNDPNYDAQLGGMENTLETYDGALLTKEENTAERLNDDVYNLLDSSDLNTQGLTFQKEESQVPLVNFEGDSQDAITEFEEETEEGGITLQDSYADTRDVAKDSMLASASTAGSAAWAVEMRGNDAMSNQQSGSKGMAMHAEKSTKRMAQNLPGLSDALDREDNALRGWATAQQTDVNKMNNNFGFKLDALRDGATSNIAGEKEGLELQLDGQGGQLQATLRKDMAQASSGAQQVIASTNGAYDSYAATQMNTLSAAERKLQKTTTKVQQVSSGTGEQAENLQGLSNRINKVRKVEAENLDFTSEQKRSAMATQQSANKEISETTMQYMTKIQDQKTKGQDLLSAATATFGDAITKESADVMFDVNSFSDRGNDEANAVKQGMVMAERQMGVQLEKLEGAALATRNVPAQTVYTSNVGVDAARREQTAQEEMASVVSQHTVALFKQATTTFEHGAQEAEQRLQKKVENQVRLVHGKEEDLRSRMVDAINDQETEKSKQSELGNGLRVVGTGMTGQTNKYELDVADYKRSSDSALELANSKVASTRQALGTARYSASLDLKQKAKDYVGEFETEQAKMIGSFSEKSAQAAKQMNDEMASILNSMNLQVEDSHGALQGGFEDGMKVAKHAEEELTKFKQDEAQDLLSPKLAEADAALKSMDDSQRKAAQESNQIIAATQGFSQVNQMTINNALAKQSAMDKGLGDRVEGRMNELGLESQLVRDKFAATMSSVEANAMRSIGDMREEARTAAGSVGSAARDLDSQSLAMSSAMVDQIGRIEARMASETNSVDGAGESARLEGMRASSGIGVLSKNIARESAELDYGAQQLEKAVGGVIAGVDSDSMKAKSGEQFNAFKGMVQEGIDDEQATAKSATNVINNLLFGTNMEMETVAKKVTALGQRVTEPISEIPKQLGSVQAHLNSDEVWARSTLQDLHDLGASFKQHVQQRRERLGYVHDDTEHELERATSMSKMADGGALDGVIARLAQAMHIDQDINWQIEHKLNPQTEHWRTGIGTVFDELGANLDLEAVANRADAAMSRAKMQGQNMDAASQAVEGALRASQKKNELMLAGVQHRQKRLIREAMHNNNLSAQEKIAEVKKIKEEMQKEGQMYASQLANMADATNNEDIETQEKANQLGQLVDRAALIAEGPRDAPKREALAQQTDRVKQSLFILKNPDSVPEFMRQTSLLETASADNKSGAAVATFHAIEEKLATVDKKRDAQESEIEAALEGLMSKGQLDPATLRTH